jgi:hypothetical protein
VLDVPGGRDAGAADGAATGWAARKVVNDLVMTFCCLECLNILFQQANGRNVDVTVAMGWDVELGKVKLKHHTNSRRTL